MDVLFIIVMFIVVTIIDNLGKRKKPRLPQNRNDRPNFDIPTLANDPNLTVELRPREVEPPKKIPAQTVREENQSPELDLEFTPSAIVNGFILSELLDKPKALRRRRR